MQPEFQARRKSVFYFNVTTRVGQEIRMKTQPTWTEWGEKGRWTISADALYQHDASADLAGCWKKIPHADFTVRFTMRANAESARDAETKFLFAKADKGETHRIDFMYAHHVCRITFGRAQRFAALMLEPRRGYDVCVKVREHFISVLVNDIPIFVNEPFNGESDRRIGFGTNNTSAEFSSILISHLIAQKCFVMMPFDERRNLVYEQVIKPALSQHPDIYFDTIRADEKATAGKITDEISTDIQDADLIVAEITKDNLNVYYEIGYAHAFGKPVILLVQKREGRQPDIPFDLRGIRYQSYSFSDGGFKDLRTRLIKVAATECLRVRMPTRVVELDQVNRVVDASGARTEGRAKRHQRRKSKRP
jgi:hypothetical protein